MFETIWAQTDGRYKDILEPALELAIEIAREGREAIASGSAADISRQPQSRKRPKPSAD